MTKLIKCLSRISWFYQWHCLLSPSKSSVLPLAPWSPNQKSSSALASWRHHWWWRHRSTWSCCYDGLLCFPYSETLISLCVWKEKSWKTFVFWCVSTAPGLDGSRKSEILGEWVWSHLILEHAPQRGWSQVHRPPWSQMLGFSTMNLKEDNLWVQGLNASLEFLFRSFPLWTKFTVLLYWCSKSAGYLLQPTQKIAHTRTQKICCPDPFRRIALKSQG